MTERERQIVKACAEHTRDAARTLLADSLGNDDPVHRLLAVMLAGAMNGHAKDMEETLEEWSSEKAWWEKREAVAQKEAAERALRAALKAKYERGGE